MQKLKLTVILVLLVGSMFVLTTTSGVRMTPEEFFDDFTPEDRLHIRKAIDYAIPRQQIIDSVLLGQGVPLATPIERNVGGYDDSVQAREFSIEKALDEMEAAFGYRYNDSAEDDEDRKGYFAMTIMAPTSRDDRMQWAALITKTLQEIGIDVTLKYANWNVAVSVFTPPIDKVGFDYAHGGYDAFFIGWTGSPQADVSQWFGEDNFAPAGYNIGFIDDPTCNDLITKSLSEKALADRVEALSDFQNWFHDNLPYYIVLQLMDLWALDPDLKGVSFSYDYPNFANWTHETASAITVQTPGDLKNTNPFRVSSYYDWLAGIGNSGLFEGLITNYPADPLKYYGVIAEDGWTVSADGLVYTMDIRDGIKFNDGSDLTVDDVVFSFKQFLNPDTVSVGGTDLGTWLNASNVVKIDENTVEFTFNDYNCYAENLLGGVSILSEAEMSLVPSTEWPTDATTTEAPPLGSGPYMWDVGASDVTESQVKMILNPYYDGSLRENTDYPANDDMIETINVKLISTAAAAVAALSTGEINVIDSNVAIQPFMSEINGSTWGRLEKVLGWGHQGFYLNQKNPIWGMHPADPRVMYPEDYAGGAPFDLASVFFGILFLTAFQIIRRKKK